MTASINNTTATAIVNKNGEVVLKVSGQELTLPVEAVTAVVTALLAGRKAAYGAERTAQAEAKAPATAEREAKKAERAETAATKKAERVAKLEAKLAELKAA